MNERETVQVLKVASLCMDFPDKRKGYFRSEVLQWFGVIAAGVVATVLLIGAFSSVFGSDWEVSAAYCPDIWSKHWQSEGMNHDALEVALRGYATKSVFGALSLRRLHATLTYPHDIDGQWFQGNETTLDLSARLGWQQHLVGPLYGDIYGGLGYMFDQRQPEFGDSGVLAHLAVMLVIKGEHWKAGYGLAHYSDPTQHGDMGRNYQVVMVGIVW